MILETSRTIVREWLETDIPAYAEMVADPDVMRFIGHGSVQTFTQATAFVHHMREQAQERDWIRWAVEGKATGELMDYTYSCSTSATQ